MSINFANIIALPLLLGVGVAFNLYFVINWRNGVTAHLQSATTRAVRALSPVTITTRTPSAFRRATSGAESVRGGSLMAMAPAICSGSAAPQATTSTR